MDQPKEIIPAVHRALKVTGEGRPVLLEFITKEELQLSRYCEIRTRKKVSHLDGDEIARPFPCRAEWAQIFN